MVRRMLDEDTVYSFVGEILFARFCDEDFADLYPKTSQPIISPVLLSFVLIFKALARCSNRQAAINVRYRLDWKYALHLPPESSIASSAMSSTPISTTTSLPTSVRGPSSNGTNLV
jgi:hypothetical protein